MLTIVYSFNKKGYEAEFWQREIAAASTDEVRFVPFNHDGYLNPFLYVRAQLLDNLYYARHPGLGQLYAACEATIRRNQAAALLVDNCNPYHPDYLRNVPLYKVLRIADGPISAYDRDFAYQHAYDLILYHSRPYSADLEMAEKLRYCGAEHTYLWRHGLFEAMHDGRQTEETLFAGERDIDIIFIGALHPGKMPVLAKVKKAFGRRCRMYGWSGVKKNLYFNVMYGFPCWMRTAPAEAVVGLYQRAKVGFNLHNRGKYTFGNYRLFELPANGVMQISDGAEYLAEYFKPGEEVVGYEDVDELIDKLRYYLGHDDERQRIAQNAYRRVMRDHRMRDRLQEAGLVISEHMRQGKRRSVYRLAQASETSL
jgi:spore maturation protein CgeB